MAASIAAGVSACGNTKSTAATDHALKTGEPAPEFRLKSPDGKEISLSEFKGRVALVEFWATWCPPCRASVSGMRELQKKYGERGFSVIGVSLDEGDDTTNVLRKFNSENKLNYTIVSGTKDVARSYGIISIPAGVLVDRTGRISHIFMGYSDQMESEMSGLIERLL